MNSKKRSLAKIITDDIIEYISDNDSMHAEEVSALCGKIKALKYQNEINIHRLFALSSEDKKCNK